MAKVADGLTALALSDIPLMAPPPEKRVLAGKHGF